jgi:TP901 family phage tail tape measure protein
MALTRDLVLQIRAINRASKQLKVVRKDIEAIHLATQRLNTGQPISGKGMKNYTKEAKKANKETKKLNRTFYETVEATKNLDGSITTTRKKFDRLGRMIDSNTKTVKKMKKGFDEAGKSAKGLGGFLKGLTNSTRVSAEGFGKMIANNATWLAGFALLSGVIAATIGLFTKLVDRQNQFAKAGRLITTTIEDQTERATALADSYDAMSEQLARTGRSAEDVTEVQYQLLSAGLQVNEMLGAMAPTLDLIDATGAEVTATTKIMAGIMNNYSDSMFRASDGSIVFSSAQDAVNNGLEDNVTTFEKTTRVVDIMATAFRDHQVELQELRDGLRFAAATTKVANVQFDELVAVLVTLEDRMVKGGRAGRSLRVMLARLVKEPEKVKEAFGVAFDPTAYRPMIKFINEVGERFQKMPAGAEKLALAFERFGLRGSDAFIQTALNAEALNENMGKLDETADGTALAMAEVMRNTPERAFDRLGQAITNLVDAMGGKELVRALADLAIGFAKIFEWMSKIYRFRNRFKKAFKEAFKGSVKDLNTTAAGFKNLGSLIKHISRGSLPEWIDAMLKAQDAQKKAKEELAEHGEELNDYIIKIKEAYTENTKLAETVSNMARLFSALSVGDSLANGMTNAGDAFKELSFEMEKAKDSAAIEAINAHINTFNTSLKWTNATFEGFATFTEKAITPAVQGFQNATKEVEKYTTAVVDSQFATQNLSIAMTGLGIKGANDLMGLSNSLGLGVSSGIKFLDTVNQMEPQIQALRDEYAKLNAEGASQEKLVSVYEKLTALQEKESVALEKANNALAVSIPLLQRRLSSTKKALDLNEKYADQQRRIAEDTDRSASVREKASKREEEFLNKSIALLRKQAEDRAKMSEISFKKGEISEYQHQQKVLDINEKTANEIQKLQSDIEDSYSNRLELQTKKEEEASRKLENAKDVLEEYDTLVKNIGTTVSQLPLDELADSLKRPFEGSLESIKKVHEEIKKITEELDGLTSKTHVIKVREERIPTPEAAQFGGLMGYATTTMVSAGEGFVDPRHTKHNLPALQALNQGNAISMPFSIPTFQGPSGIDNIKTTLPPGSFVVSRRGMDALERSSEQVRSATERKHYQMGGLIPERLSNVHEKAEEDLSSRFDLVINLGGEERRFPLQGSKTTIDELSEELERQNMTRL